MVRYWFSHVMLLATCVCADACTSPACPDGTFATVSGTQLRVAQTCGDDSGDGSAEAPFKTISKAAAAAAAGTTIVVGAGTYPETVKLRAGISLRGAGSTAVIIAPPTGQAGVVADGAAAITLQGFAVRGAGNVGISVAHSSATVTDIAVSGTQRVTVKEKLVGGHGIQFTDATTVRLDHVTVRDNEGTGLLAWRVRTVSIVDPSFIVDPGFAPEAAVGADGIVDPSFLPHNSFVNNWGGGVAIVDPSFAPLAAKPDTVGIVDPSFDVGGAAVQRNKGFGIALFGASAKMTRMVITGTAKLDNSDIADGVVVTTGTVPATRALDVSLASNVVVADNARSGVLTSCDKTAPFALRAVIGGQIGRNALGGAWAQGQQAVVAVDASARISANRMVGVAATDAGLVQLNAARIDHTVAVGWLGSTDKSLDNQVGDGVGVFAGGRAVLTGTRLDNNPRAGLHLRSPGKKADGSIDVVATGVTVDQCPIGIAFDGATTELGTLTPDAAVKVTGAAEKARENAKLQAHLSPCSPSDAAANCAPARPASNP